MKEEKQIESLDDFDTDMLQTLGWSLDKIFYGDEVETMKFYEKAMQHADTIVSVCPVGLRAVTRGDTCFWEVWKRKHNNKK